MQHFSDEGQASNGLGISQTQQPQASNEQLIQFFAAHGLATQQIDNNFDWQAQLAEDFYDSPQDLNRRTLTQENFNDISRNGGMVNGHGHFEELQTGFSGNQDILSQVFGDISEHDLKQELPFPYTVGAPLSSNDSSVPSIMSDQSYGFPSNNAMQGRADMSVTSSDWADSRSSSLSMLHPDNALADLSTSQPQLPVSNSQWQPGQSIPVDVDKHYEEFRQVAQNRASAARAFEQPLAFPTDAAFARRASQASMLAQSMGDVNIHPQQPNQSDVFKSPAPPANIAARRQRPKPANLGLAALRSASYSGARQPGSPGQGPASSHLTQDQHIRRIRSAAVMNGGIAHGRIMKSTPGSAQRSPVNWAFAQSMVSPHLVRNMSHGSLAPPTPMSPHDLASEQMMHNPAFQSASYAAPQPIINEADYDQNLGGLQYQPSASVPPQNFTSPPHTPMFYDQSFVPRRVGSNVITENTPPQSAPAGQSCFPSNIWAKAPSLMNHHPLPQQPVPQRHEMQGYTTSQPQQIRSMHTEQQVQGPTVTFARAQQSNVTTGPTPGIPLQFANGIPTLTPEGTVKMSFPPKAQLMQQQSQQMSTPPQQQYAFVTTTSGSPSMHTTTHTMTQPRSELFVHEYNPPGSVRRSSTPRRPSEMTPQAPKHFTFTNHGPLDFEGKRARKSGEAREGSTSCSPASSSGTASTS